MATAHDFSQRLPAAGTSQELTALTDTFNELMASLVAAEQATEGPTSRRSRDWRLRSTRATRTPPATPSASARCR